MASGKGRSRSVKAVLNDVGEQIGNSDCVRHGTIALRLGGRGGGEFCLSCAPGSARLTEGVGAGPHMIEIMGPAARIRAILERKKDGRKQFLAGGIRIRGDIRYLSDLAMELGLIKEPI